MSANVRSMTGYGRGEHIAEDRKFVVEMKSVNHRYNDMTIKLPRSLASLEDKIKKRIMRDVFRGKTDVYISFETFSADDVDVKLNETLAAAYIEKLNLLEEKFGLTGGNKLELAAKFPDVITVEKAQQEEAVIWEALAPAKIRCYENRGRRKPEKGYPAEGRTDQNTGGRSERTFSSGGCGISGKAEQQTERFVGQCGCGPSENCNRGGYFCRQRLCG